MGSSNGERGLGPKLHLKILSVFLTPDDLDTIGTIYFVYTYSWIKWSYCCLYIQNMHIDIMMDRPNRNCLSGIISNFAMYIRRK